MHPSGVVTSSCGVTFTWFLVDDWSFAYSKWPATERICDWIACSPVNACRQLDSRRSSGCPDVVDLYLERPTIDFGAPAPTSQQLSR